MDEQRLKEFFTAIGTLAEMALLFYRSSIAAKATPEEAFRITQAFIAAALSGGKQEREQGGRMMKVCILSNDAPAVFQSSINAFIADKKVIDIKYQSMMLPLKFTNGVPSESTIIDRALIIYEE